MGGFPGSLKAGMSVAFKGGARIQRAINIALVWANVYVCIR